MAKFNITEALQGSNVNKLAKTALIDVLLVAAVCLLPALSHLAAVPFYKLNPMLLLLLSGMILVNDRRNAYLLAVALPFVSSMLVGMPTTICAVCIAVEYIVLVSIFNLFCKRSGFVGIFAAIFGAIVLAKLVYYGMKWLLLSPEVLISTPILLQLVVTIATAALFAAIYVRQR